VDDKLAGTGVAKCDRASKPHPDEVPCVGASLHAIDEADRLLRRTQAGAGGDSVEPSHRSKQVFEIVGAPSWQARDGSGNLHAIDTRLSKDGCRSSAKLMQRS
jgi:hypothetical protein